MKFSILIANYNNGKYFKDCYDSILAQTHTDWEVIIVDDKSTDHSVNTISNLIKDDYRFKLFENEKNYGCGYTKRRCVELATGVICGFLDPDDALLPLALERMIEAHQEYPSASMINSDCFQCDENLNILDKYEFYKPVPPGQTLIKNLTVGSFATFKRSAYLKTAGINPKFKRAVDHDLYLKLDEVGALEYIHESFYLYRINASGISQNSNGIKARQFSILAILDAHKRRSSLNMNNITSNEAKALKKTWYLREAYFQRIGGNRKESDIILYNALKEFPSIAFNKTWLMAIIRNKFGSGSSLAG